MHVKHESHEDDNIRAIVPLVRFFVDDILFSESTM